MIKYLVFDERNKLVILVMALSFILLGCYDTPTPPITATATKTNTPPPAPSPVTITPTLAVTALPLESIIIPGEPVSTGKTVTAIQFVIDDSLSINDSKCDDRADLRFQLPSFVFSLMATYEHIIVSNKGDMSGLNHDRLFMGVLRYGQSNIYEPIPMQTVQELSKGDLWKRKWNELISQDNDHIVDVGTEGAAALSRAYENLNSPETERANRKIVFITDGIFSEGAFRKIKESLTFMGNIDVYFVLMCESNLLFNPTYQELEQYREIKHFVESPDNKILEQPIIHAEKPIEDWMVDFIRKLLGDHLPDENRGNWVEWETAEDSEDSEDSEDIPYTLPLSFTGQARHYQLALISYADDLSPTFALDDIRSGASIPAINDDRFYWYYNSRSTDNGGPLSPPGSCNDHELTISTKQNAPTYYLFIFDKPPIELSVDISGETILASDTNDLRLEITAEISTEMSKSPFNDFADCFEAVVASNFEGKQIMHQDPTPLQRNMKWDVNIPLDRASEIQFGVYLRPVANLDNEPPLFTYLESLSVEFEPVLLPSNTSVYLGCPKDDASDCSENKGAFYLDLSFLYKGDLDLDDLLVEIQKPFDNNSSSCHQATFTLSEPSKQNSDSDPVVIIPRREGTSNEFEWNWRSVVFRPENSGVTATLKEEFLMNCGDMMISWKNHPEWPIWECSIALDNGKNDIKLDCGGQ